MPEFLCNKVVDLEPATLFILKKDCSTSVYLWILRIFSEDLPLKKIWKQLLLEMLFYVTFLGDCFHISEDLTYVLKKFYNFLLHLQLS